jgi:NAD(P)-dependent dehydrogenase (short-subunit alcohol dehydrogenase family)
LQAVEHPDAMALAAPAPRIILITGANRGLGRLIAERLATPDHVLLLACRDVAAGRRVAEALRPLCRSCFVLKLDITRRATIEQLGLRIAKRYGLLHGLVNNAGIFLHPEDLTIASLSWDGLVSTLQTNLLGPFWLLKCLRPLLQKADSACVVNVTSDMAEPETCIGDYSAYRMSKAGLNSFTFNLAAALKPEGILVNGIDPGWIPTDMGGPEATDDLNLAAALAARCVQLPPGGLSGKIFRAVNLSSEADIDQLIGTASLAVPDGR